MANWRQITLDTYPTGAYVDLSGSDITGDGSPNNPYLTPNNASTVGSPGYTRPIIVGQGLYTGTILTSQDNIIGEDGLEKYTIFNLNGGTYQTAIATTTKNVTIKNGTVYSPAGVPVTGLWQNVIFINCTIEDPTSTSAWFQDFTNCEFINCSLFQNGRSRSRFSRCKFINSIVYNVKATEAGWGCYKLESCDVDAFSKIQFTSNANILAYGELIDYNNVRGELMFQEGTNVDSYIDLATAITNYPTVVGTHNINADPLYHNVSKLALGVDPSSPNLGAGKNNFNIGNCTRSIGLFNNVTPSMTVAGGAIITDLDGTNDLTVTPSATYGYHTTGSITINSLFVEEIGKIDYIGLIATDSTLGGVANQQVPDTLDHPIGNSGNRPESLSYEMRFSTDVDGVWDNGGYINVGDWSTFAFGQQPILDSAFVGNGDGAHNQNDAAKFVVGAKWIQIRVRLVKENWNTI
jgi:hypothetical protein